MKTMILEVTQRQGEAVVEGAFLLGAFDDEFGRPSLAQAKGISRSSALGRFGWCSRHILVIDLETGNGELISLLNFLAVDHKAGESADPNVLLDEALLKWVVEQYQWFRTGSDRSTAVCFLEFLEHLASNFHDILELPAVEG